MSALKCRIDWDGDPDCKADDAEGAAFAAWAFSSDLAVDFFGISNTDDAHLQKSFIEASIAHESLHSGSGAQNGRAQKLRHAALGASRTGGSLEELDFCSKKNKIDRRYMDACQRHRIAVQRAKLLVSAIFVMIKSFVSTSTRRSETSPLFKMYLILQKPAC
jgi:hypothetical protein